MAEPTSIRPVFSTRDIGLLRRAVVEFIRTHEGDPEMPNFVALHHRLGRIGR